MDSPSAEPLRVAVLGAGAMAAVHAEAYSAIADVTVAVVFGRTPAKVAELAERVGATATNDFATILRDDTVGAVDICLPTPEHSAFVVAALEAGKHVFCETPLTLDLADALAMRNAARRKH